MLVGTGNVADFERGAPKMIDLDTEALVLPGTHVLQVLSEIDSDDMCEMLPPALHPTLPPVVAWSFYHCPESPFGEFTLAQTRIECRSGLRPRGLLVNAATDNAKAADALATRFGFRIETADVSLHRGYDEVRGVVEYQDEVVLDIAARDTQPVGLESIQFVSSIHPASTPKGFRLVQVDFEHAVTRAERGEAVVDEFDGEAWEEERIEPTYPIAAGVCTADVTLAPLRFMCRADVMAFEGTEPV
jgi:hypothetical protein